MKKKVLFFLQMSVGGAERMAVLYAKMLNPEKYTPVFCLVSKGKTTSSISDFIPKSFQCRNIQERNSLRLIWKLNRIICSEKPDIVFSSIFYFSNKLLLQKVLFRSTKFIIRCENYFFTFSKKQQLMMKFLYKYADRIIVQTEEMRDELIKNACALPENIRVLYNPVDGDLIAQKMKKAQNPYPSNGKKHFVASGRFAYQKGFDMLVDALAMVKKKRDDVDLFILGAIDGKDKDEFERVWAIVQKYHMEDDVHCVGFQTNPYCYVKFADAFVLSSRWEGLPNVLVESLHLGTPVAAFNCVPVIQRIVQSGVDGFIAEKDNVESLSEAMVCAVNLGRIVSCYQGTTSEEINLLFNQM